MAKIDVIENVAVLKSALKPEEILALAKYDPERLSLYKYNDDDQTVKYFTIGYVTPDSNETGSVSKYGVIFDTKSRADGLATVTINVPAGTEDVQGYIVDNYGSIVINLMKVEGDLNGALDRIKRMEANLIEAITIH
jgi:hypothetical protein